MSANPSQKPRDHPAPSSTIPGHSTEVAASLQFLDNLKELVLDHLARIESLAKLAMIDLGTEPSEVERTLKERVLVLEAAQARLVASSARRDLEWREFLEDLEHDRNRLAEAWQNLEDERLRSAPPAHAEQVQRAARVPVEGPSRSRSEPAEEATTTEVISREILRQFRSLQGDVRRTLKS